MYRLQDNVPEYLIDESRDFQLLCRLYDCNNNGVKFSIDSIVRVMNTTTCGSGFLKLLETRLGFLTDGQYTDSEIRDILFGFCDMVKYKGSELGIARAVRTFLVAKNIKVPTSVEIDKDTKNVRIGLRSRNLDTSLLDDILRYVLPAGSSVDYFYYLPDQRRTPLEFGERVIWIFARDIDTSRIVSSYDMYTNSSSVRLDFDEQNINNVSYTWKNFNSSSSDGYGEYTLKDRDKVAIDNILSSVGFTNIYSPYGDNSEQVAPWNNSTSKPIGVIETVDDFNPTNSSSGE